MAKPTPPQKDSSPIRGPLLLLTGAAAVSMAAKSREPFLLKIGAALTTIRKARGLSLAALSLQSGIPAWMLSALEGGRTDSLSLFATVEALLDVKPGFILRAANWRLSQPE